MVTLKKGDLRREFYKRRKYGIRTLNRYEREREEVMKELDVSQEVIDRMRRDRTEIGKMIRDKTVKKIKQEDMEKLRKSCKNI